MSEAAPRNLDDRDEARRLDAEDVARTLAGDTSAYDALIERYQRRGVAVAYRFLGNSEDAMDVCQDAFLRAFKSLATLKQPERFGAWLMRIVSNLSLNFRRGRRATLSLTTGDEAGGVHEDQLVSQGTGQDGSPDPRALAQSSELEGAVSAAIEELPKQQRLALVLFAIEQIPQKQVAEIMECSVEMVKWNVFQARKALKEKLAEYLQE